MNIKPVTFPEVNIVLGAPKGLESEVEPVEAFTDGNQTITLWKMGVRERLIVLFTGRVWLSCMGQTMPPSYLKVGRMFLKPTKDEGK